MATPQDPLAPTNVPMSVTNGHPEKDQTGMRVRVSEMTDQVRHTASDFGRSAAQNIDRNLDRAAGALERTSSALRSRTGESSGRVNRYAQTTADKLDATARYFREHHTNEVMTGVEGFARRKPAVAIGTAAGLGFLIGMLMKRDRYRY